MTKFWEGFTYTDFYKDRFLDGIVALFDNPGYYDTSPSVATFDKLLTGSPKRNIILGTVDLTTGFYVSYNNTHTEDWTKITMASMAIPGAFPYIEIGN